MDTLTKAKLLLHLARWRFTWSKRDLGYLPRGLDKDIFITARDAAQMIKDGQNVFSSGMAANARCSIFFWAVRELFEKTGSPKDLTWIVVGAQGSRGRVPGTLEELNYPGLITRFIAGHAETVKALLKLGDEGHVEVHTMPQGVQTFLLEAQAAGKKTLTTDTGLGSFLDPRVGGGTYVGGKAMTENFVKAYGEKLRYHLPLIDHALFVAPYADREGNIYMKHAATYTESYESSLASRANGGKVIASVSGIIEKDEKNIYLTKDQVDHIVVNPRSEQTGGIPQRRYWPMFTTDHGEPTAEAVEKLKFVNNTLKITPVRNPVELAIARLAAKYFTQIAAKGALVNIGVGLGEEVCRLIYEGGLHEDVTFFSETGVVGGLPTPGIFFGAAINPEKMITSAQVFHMAYENLDATMLGLLEVDSEGNTNLSNRGPRILDYVGPGGMPDLVAAAKNIFFVGSWMMKGRIELEDGQVKIKEPGEHKFMDKVKEISFSGKQALAMGKNVYYITSVGVFQLTKKGMMLIQAMPGIDIQKDILDACPMKVVLPKDGKVPVVEKDIVTGEGFSLSWPTK